MKSNTIHRGDLNCTTNDVTHLLNLAIELFIEGKNFLKGRIKGSPLRGKAKLLLVAIDDQHVVMRLHGLQLLTYGGLRHFIEPSRLGEAFCLDQIAEGFEILDVHRIHV